jgi:hypothetical protein
MLNLLLVPFQLAAAAPPPVYQGYAGEIAVIVPRVEVEPSIDGVLDEPVWASAAVLTGFSQYEPVDGLPAEDDTEVLIWYAPTGIYIGIRAHEPHAPVNATLADRDRIFGDDFVQVLLDPFHDGRRALVFAVNPFGVQADGTQSEERRSRSGMFTADETSAAIDLSPDYIFESEGRLVDGQWSSR